jgi:hypothetical protein
MPRGTTVRTTLAIALATTATIAWAAAPSTAIPRGSSHDASGWSKVPIPRHAGLLAVTGTSTSDVWAVGYIYNQQIAVYRPVAMHSAGGAFVDTKIPRKGRRYSVFNAVAAVAPNDVWAAGYWNTIPTYTGSGLPLFEHWDGTAWRVVPSPDVGRGQVWGLAAVAANDVWAVGELTDASTLVEHWDGSSWSRVQAPHGNGLGWLFGVSARSANDVWAAGAAYHGSELDRLVLHWDGSSWAEFPSANSPDEYNELAAIFADPASDDLWAVGNRTPGLGYFQLSEWYDGTNWTVLSAPPGHDEVVLNGVYGRRRRRSLGGELDVRVPSPDPVLERLGLGGGPDPGTGRHRAVGDHPRWLDPLDGGEQRRPAARVRELRVRAAFIPLSHAGACANPRRDCWR